LVLIKFYVGPHSPQAFICAVFITRDISGLGLGLGLTLSWPRLHPWYSDSRSIDVGCRV